MMAFEELTTISKSTNWMKAVLILDAFFKFFTEHDNDRAHNHCCLLRDLIEALIHTNSGKEVDQDMIDKQIAVEAIVHSASKKDRCTGLLTKAVPVLKHLYHNGNNDNVKVGLCKLGSFQGSDATTRPMAEGSTITLAKACRKFLTNPAGDIHMKQWATEGLAYLALDADVKEEVVNDPKALVAIIQAAKLERFRNEILHSSMKKLAEKEYEQFKGNLIKLLKSPDFVKNPGTIVAINKKIKLHMQKHVSLQYNYDACEMVDETVYIIAEYVDNLSKPELIQKFLDDYESTVTDKDYEKLLIEIYLSSLQNTQRNLQKKIKEEQDDTVSSTIETSDSNIMIDKYGITKVLQHWMSLNNCMTEQPVSLSDFWFNHFHGNDKTITKIQRRQRPYTCTHTSVYDLIESMFKSIIAGEQEKIYTKDGSDMKTDKMVCKCKAEMVEKSALKPRLKQLPLCYEPEIFNTLLLFEEILFLPINSHETMECFELELKHINLAYISSLTSCKTMPEKILAAWLNRLMFRSLNAKENTCDIPNKHKAYEIMFKMTSDNEELSQDFKTNLGPTVCVHEYEYMNSIHVAELERDNDQPRLSHDNRGSFDRVQTDERNSSLTINRRDHGPGTTVDLKTVRTSPRGVDQESLKSGNENDSLKDIICHENRNVSRNFDTTVCPVFGNKNDNSEQTVETNTSLNDNDNSSVSDGNSATFREQTMAIETNSSSNSETVYMDGHSRGALHLPSTDENLGTITHEDENCHQRSAEPTEELYFKIENEGENPSRRLNPDIAGVAESDLPNPEVDQAEFQRFEPLMQIIDKIADGERVPPQITMRYEILRFCTLRSFPKHNKPYITRLAAAGFYYANTDDEVVCYTCAKRKRNWREDDIPMDIHRELNPNCSFLLRNSEVNVPVRMFEFPQDSPRATHSQCSQNAFTVNTTSSGSTTSNNISTLTSQAQLTRDLAKNITVAVTSSPSPVDSAKNALLQQGTQQRAHGNFVQTLTPSPNPVGQERQSNHLTVSNSSNGTPVGSTNSVLQTSQLSIEGTNASTAPKYPRYATKTARLTSFNDCGDIVIPPDRLAESGFYFAGFGDCVRCFQCGVGLRHWSDEDDPWIEHSRWSKDCLFVKQVKGQEFVNLVQMAVQYSQNQNRNEQTSNGNTTGTNSQTSEDAVIEQQMHTDAAQSVLEMGYDANVIRNALHALRSANGGQSLNAATLMEKIFEMEDESSNLLENSPEVPETNFNQQVTRSEQNTENSNTGRTSLDQSSTASSSVRSQSAAVGFSSAEISGSVAQGSSRSHSKKSQLLEQKKLKQENEALKQQSLCTKCKQNDVCIVFLPCGHLVTCETCAPTVRYCSVEDCGKYIKGTVRTYLA